MLFLHCFLPYMNNYWDLFVIFVPTINNRRSNDYRYFKHIVDGMNLTNCKVPLNIDPLERSIKGVYSESFVDWSESGLAGKSLDEYNDTKQCTEVFLKILSNKRPKK